jgi:hypothetical protein
LQHAGGFDAERLERVIESDRHLASLAGVAQELSASGSTPLARRAQRLGFRFVLDGDRLVRPPLQAERDLPHALQRVEDVGLLV